MDWSEAFKEAEELLVMKRLDEERIRAERITTGNITL
jgi:hypothetical protein